jgi:hypothetical protein
MLCVGFVTLSSKFYVISGGAFSKQRMLVSMHGLIEWIKCWLAGMY